MMLNIKESIKNINLDRTVTAIIIVGIIVATIVGMSVYSYVRHAKVEAAGVFEIAKEKIDEFDTMNNFYSKVEVHKEIISILDQVYGKYPWTPTGKRALFYKGYILYNVEEYEKAEKVLTYFVKKNKSNYLSPKAYYILSYCYSDLKKVDEAIKTLEVFEKRLHKSYYTPLAYYRMAFLYEQKKETADAIKYYQRIVDEFPDSSQKEMALKKLLILKNEIVL